ncbi:MAG: GNAT family N-acetyltransferase [Hyphomicrobiaceae bacterium]|nr:GNAT family N-acetyltransferase [Hyphomicrobiaceae bacterium]
MLSEIRQIREHDIDSFYDTFSMVVRESRYLAFLEPPPIEATRAFVRRNIECDFPQRVAIVDDKVVGWCDITPPGREVMAHVGILGIALHPAWRNQGLGGRLMRAALDAAWAFGFLRVELDVFSHNVRAQALYRKLGFLDEGVKRRRILIDGHFHDEMMMAIFKP